MSWTLLSWRHCCDCYGMRKEGSGGRKDEVAKRDTERNSVEGGSELRKGSKRKPKVGVWGLEGETL
jgi:hypothetical protein